MQPVGPEVFRYLDFREFLRDWYAYKKERNPRFSHRMLARKAGLRSSATFLNVIEGRRNPGPQVVEALARALGLGVGEAAYFGHLVRMQCADDPATREHALEQVRATQRFRDARRLDRQAIEFLARWYLPALHELSACEGFQAEPSWIAGAMRPTITEEQAREGLGVLRDLGLLVEREGRWIRADASVVTPHEVGGLAVRQYHRGMIERAKDALDYPSSERHLCGVTVAVSPAALTRLKRELDALQERVLEMCDGDTEPRTLVVQVNLQAVPLSVDLRSREP